MKRPYLGLPESNVYLGITFSVVLSPLSSTYSNVKLTLNTRLIEREIISERENLVNSDELVRYRHSAVIGSFYCRIVLSFDCLHLGRVSGGGASRRAEGNYFYHIADRFSGLDLGLRLPSIISERSTPIANDATPEVTTPDRVREEES